MKKDLFKEFQEFVKSEYGYEIKSSKGKDSFDIRNLFPDVSEEFFCDYMWNDSGLLFYDIVDIDSRVSFEEELFVSDNELGFDALNLAA